MSPVGNAQSLKLASDVKLDSRRLYINCGVHGEINSAPAFLVGCTRPRLFRIPHAAASRTLSFDCIGPALRSLCFIIGCCDAHSAADQG